MLKNKIIFLVILFGRLKKNSYICIVNEKSRRVHYNIVHRVDSNTSIHKKPLNAEKRDTTPSLPNQTNKQTIGTVCIF